MIRRKIYGRESDRYNDSNLYGNSKQSGTLKKKGTEFHGLDAMVEGEGEYQNNE